MLLKTETKDKLKMMLRAFRVYFFGTAVLCCATFTLLGLRQGLRVRGTAFTHYICEACTSAV